MNWRIFTMKIAVTYDNGNVFQHFGKTENFKVYEVEDDKVVSSEVIGSNGTGHGALAGLLAEQGINVLICGGIGEGAQTALTEAGIEMVAGAQSLSFWKATQSGVHLKTSTGCRPDRLFASMPLRLEWFGTAIPPIRNT